MDAFRILDASFLTKAGYLKMPSKTTCTTITHSKNYFELMNNGNTGNYPHFYLSKPTLSA